MSRFRWIASVVLAGCAVLPAGPTVATLPQADGFPSVPVALDDPGGLVEGVALSPTDESLGPPTIGAGGVDTVIVTWIGGACDSRVRLRVTRADDLLDVALRTDAANQCNAAGIERSIAITLHQPIADRTLHLDLGS